MALYTLQQVGIIGYVEVVAPAHLKGTAISLASGCMFFIGKLLAKDYKVSPGCWQMKVNLE